MLTLEQMDQLSCTTPRQRDHDMHGFDMPLEASIAATYASELRTAYPADGKAIAMDNKLSYMAIREWDHFCGRRS